MSSLKAQTVTMGPEHAVIGTHSGILKDDVNGATLVIQAERTQTRVKLSDLISFLKEQAAEMQKAEAFHQVADVG